MKRAIDAIYDKMLYAYCYVEVFMWQMEDYHKNTNWVKQNAEWVEKNGRHNGDR